jgi:hypothetical protein
MASHYNLSHDFQNNQMFWSKLKSLESGLNTKDNNTYANIMPDN